MAGPGQKRRFGPRSPTVRFALDCRHRAALPRTAVVGQVQTPAPQQQHHLFDDLVGASKKQLRHGDTERLGGLEVDDEGVLGPLLYRQVTGFCTLEDAIDLTCCLPVVRRKPRELKGPSKVRRSPHTNEDLSA
jgi:hypothetical protein